MSVLENLIERTDGAIQDVCNSGGSRVIFFLKDGAEITILRKDALAFVRGFLLGMNYGEVKVSDQENQRTNRRFVNFWVEKISRGHRHAPDYLRARAEAYEREAKSLARTGEDGAAQRFREIAKGLRKLAGDTDD